MMKDDIEKNTLDLSYKRNLQLLNAVLIIGGSTLVASFVSLILAVDRLLEYSILFTTIGIITFVLYNSIDSTLRDISLQIRNIKITSS